MTDALGEITEGLTGLCRDRTGDPTASVVDVRPMPGHAGFSYGFGLTSRSEHRDLVLRLPPPGARASGTADVVRQARLLPVLAERGVPVPPVLWYGEDPAWFGRPWSVVALLPGRTQSLDPAESARPLDAAAAERVALGAVAALARLHALEWPSPPVGYGPPLSPADEVTRWDGFLDRTADPSLVRSAPELRSRLLATEPGAPRIGLCHGDYQWSNLLVHDDRLLAVLDWELARLGPVLTDLGWLLVFSDPSSWAPGVALPPVPPPSRLAAAYGDVHAVDPAELAWFRAQAGYAFAVITGFNLMLHRRGKRVDPFWEQVAPSAPRLLDRALEVLELP